jgi:hypothetical protein
MLAPTGIATLLPTGRLWLRRAWDLPTIEAEYQRFVVEFRFQTPGDVLIRQLQLVHA